MSPRDITGSLRKSWIEWWATNGVTDIHFHVVVSEEKLLVMTDEPGPCSTCPPALFTCPVCSPKLPGFPCNNAQRHLRKPARGLAHAGLESVSLITSALKSISPLLWSCPWHAEERKIWLLSEARLTPLPRNGTLSVGGFHGWMNEITAVFSSLKIKGLPSSGFRSIRKLMHLMSDFNSNRTRYYYFYKTNTSSS